MLGDKISVLLLPDYKITINSFVILDNTDISLLLKANLRRQAGDGIWICNK